MPTPRPPRQVVGGLPLPIGSSAMASRSSCPRGWSGVPIRMVKRNWSGGLLSDAATPARDVSAPGRDSRMPRNQRNQSLPHALQERKAGGGMPELYDTRTDDILELLEIAQVLARAETALLTTDAGKAIAELQELQKRVAALASKLVTRTAGHAANAA